MPTADVVGHHGGVRADLPGHQAPIAPSTAPGSAAREDARGFVEQLRATSANPVIYAELPGAQHGFDLFRSRRFDTVIDAIEAFTAHIRSRHRMPRGEIQVPGGWG